MLRQVFVAAGMVILAGAAQAEPPAQPNIVVILADDQGWGDLSLNGNANLQTSHIDGLGRAGARLITPSVPELAFPRNRSSGQPAAADTSQKPG